MKYRTVPRSLPGNTSLANVATAIPTGAAIASARIELINVPTMNGNAPYCSLSGFGSHTVEVRNESLNAWIEDHAPQISTHRNNTRSSGTVQTHPARLAKNI